MTEITKQKLEALQNLVNLMKADKDLPRNLQLTFEELHNYIIRNKQQVGFKSGVPVPNKYQSND